MFWLHSINFEGCEVDHPAFAQDLHEAEHQGEVEKGENHFFSRAELWSDKADIDETWCQGEPDLVLDTPGVPGMQVHLVHLECQIYILYKLP